MKYFTVSEDCTVCQNFLFSGGKKILDFCLTVLILFNMDRASQIINDPPIRVHRYVFIFYATFFFFSLAFETVFSEDFAESLWIN